MKRQTHVFAWVMIATAVAGCGKRQRFYQDKSSDYANQVCSPSQTNGIDLGDDYFNDLPLAQPVRFGTMDVRITGLYPADGVQPVVICDLKKVQIPVYEVANLRDWQKPSEVRCEADYAGMKVHPTVRAVILVDPKRNLKKFIAIFGFPSEEILATQRECLKDLPGETGQTATTTDLGSQSGIFLEPYDSSFSHPHSVYPDAPLSPRVGFRPEVVLYDVAP